MKLDIGSYVACELGNAHILDNQCVRAGLDNLRKRARSFGKLVIEHDSIKSNVSSNTPLM